MKRMIYRTIKNGRIKVYGDYYYPTTDRGAESAAYFRQHKIKWGIAIRYDGRLDKMRGKFYAPDLDMRCCVYLISLPAYPFYSQPNDFNNRRHWNKWIPTPQWFIRRHKTAQCNQSRQVYERWLKSLCDEAHPFTLTGEDVEYIKGLQP